MRLTRRALLRGEYHADIERRGAFRDLPGHSAGQNRIAVSSPGKPSGGPPGVMRS
jgi:hypothetical protein